MSRNQSEGYGNTVDVVTAADEAYASIANAFSYLEGCVWHIRDASRAAGKAQYDDAELPGVIRQQAQYGIESIHEACESLRMIPKFMGL